MFSAHWFHEEPLFIFTKNIVHLMGALAPLLAIASMKFFKLSSFFEGGKLVFQHLLFLAILTALYNTLMKFFVYSYIDNLSINAVKFIQGYLLGDILGCLAVVFFCSFSDRSGNSIFCSKTCPFRFRELVNFLKKDIYTKLLSSSLTFSIRERSCSISLLKMRVF